MGIGDEIQHSVKSLDHLFIHSACDHSQESFFHIPVFVPCPLRKYRYSGLEVAKGRMLYHALEVAVDFLPSSFCCCYASTHYKGCGKAFFMLVGGILGGDMGYIA